jgi:hypothetical protein
MSSESQFRSSETLHSNFTTEAYKLAQLLWVYDYADVVLLTEVPGHSPGQARGKFLPNDGMVQSC